MEKTNIVDPVCGMSVDSQRAAAQKRFQEKDYFFCSVRCSEKFQADPQRYLAPKTSQPSMSERVREFIPLIVIFSVISVFTVAKGVLTRTTGLMPMMLDFMAGFFLVFGGFKVVKLRGFAESYATYDLLAKKSMAYAYSYPFIEIALGLSYLFRFHLQIVNWITVFVMTISGIGVAKALLRKQRIDCACLGTVFKIPMTKVTLMEDLLMALMALIMAFRS